MSITISGTIHPSRVVRHLTVVARVEGHAGEAMAEMVGALWQPCDPGLDGDVALAAALNELAKALNELTTSFAVIGGERTQP
jgi:hypothetical protein